MGVLSAREVRGGGGSGEEGVPVAAGGSHSAEPPSVLQLRVRILEMSSVFAELPDGALRALARRMQPVQLSPNDTLRLGGRGGDVVIFLATGVAEQSITDGAGNLLLTRRPAPGDLLILPAPRTGDRYVTSIRGLAASELLTLDRDGLLEGLGRDVDKVAIALDKLWEQQVAAAAATEAQAATRASAPIVAFFSAKGGSGVSTLAVNTAAALASRFPRKVLLIDLSAPFGHAALFSDLVATGSMPGAPLDRGAVESILGHKMALSIGFDDTRPEDATLAGSLVLQRDPNSQVSRGATELARAIVGKLKLDG